MADSNADVLRALYGIMSDEGLFSGVNDDYWFNIYDGLVSALAPEMNEPE